MAKARKVNMSELARLAGVSQAAVSMALRNHPRISPARRSQIQELAREHGYQPDPYVSSLMACRRGRNDLPSACIAFVDGFPDTSHFQVQFNTRDVVQGLRERAQELGFSVERFSIADPALATGGLDRVLKARGIRGVVLGNTPEMPFHVELDWSAYSVVAVSHYFQAMPVDRVMSDPWQITETAMRELAARGYRRIGIALPAVSNWIGGRRFSGAYLDAVHTCNLSEFLPPYLPELPDASSFLAWYRQHAPDAIVYFGVDIIAHLLAAGVRIPEDVGIVAAACSTAAPVVAGVNQNAREVGATLAERVAHLLFTNSLGIPRIPRTIFVDSTWQDGWTVRQGV